MKIQVLKCWQYWKLEKHWFYPKNGKKTQNFDSKSKKRVSSWNLNENILHLTESTPWKLRKKIFQILECILCQFLTPWNILENKYFQISVDRKAFLLFSSTFTKIFDYFPWKSKFWNVDNIENWKSIDFTLKMVRKLKILTLSQRNVLVLEI